MKLYFSVDLISLFAAFHTSMMKAKNIEQMSKAEDELVEGYLVSKYAIGLEGNYDILLTTWELQAEILLALKISVHADRLHKKMVSNFYEFFETGDSDLFKYYLKHHAE